jgi:hypothetical protein
VIEPGELDPARHLGVGIGIEAGKKIPAELLGADAVPQILGTCRAAWELQLLRLCVGALVGYLPLRDASADASNQQPDERPTVPASRS